MRGILTPLLKKSSLNPVIPKHYRPEVVSTTFSKLIEMYILQECGNYQFNEYQFGFVSNRGTNMAVTLANDVASYFVNNGSQLFMCGLDVEGAFDAIPHPVLFHKSYNVYSEMSWKLLNYWYNNLTVQIKWHGLSKPVCIQKGTRQGGLTSPFAFNLVFKDLINNLSNQEGGATIGTQRFNVVGYADDILLLSPTVTGLQRLINTANEHVSRLGLAFNPKKTVCTVNGKMPFNVNPVSYINNEQLLFTENLSYLGSYLGNNNGKYHISDRISSCRKSYYSLQGAGLCDKGLSVEAATYVWLSTCNNVLLYVCNSLYLGKKELSELDKTQGKFIKCIVGLSSNYRHTSLLKALKIPKVSSFIETQNLSLLNNIFSNESAARKFYISMFNKQKSCKSLLINRCMEICNKYSVNFYKCVLDKTYVNMVKQKILYCPKDGENGLVDTVRCLLKDKSTDNMTLLRLLLKAY